MGHGDYGGRGSGGGGLLVEVAAVGVDSPG